MLIVEIIFICQECLEVFLLFLVNFCGLYLLGKTVSGFRERDNGKRTFRTSIFKLADKSKCFDSRLARLLYSS